jgi:hypothetical protein
VIVAINNFEFQGSLPVVYVVWIQWGRRDLNPYASRHMILSHACLPVPALPLAGLDYTIGELPGCLRRLNSI